MTKKVTSPQHTSRQSSTSSQMPPEDELRPEATNFGGAFLKNNKLPHDPATDQMRHVNFVVLNFNGQPYQINETVLQRLPIYNRIMMVSIQVENEYKKTTEYFLENNISCFRAVVHFYKHGGLHIPRDVCMTVFKQEMLFWEIDLSELSSCCALEFAKFDKDLSTANEFRRSCLHKDRYNICGLNAKKNLMKITSSAKMRKLRKEAYKLINLPSLRQKIYQLIVYFFVILSVATMIFNADFEKGRENLQKQQWDDYFRFKGDEREKLCRNPRYNMTKRLWDFCKSDQAANGRKKKSVGRQPSFGHLTMIKDTDDNITSLGDSNMSQNDYVPTASNLNSPNKVDIFRFNDTKQKVPARFGRQAFLNGDDEQVFKNLHNNKRQALKLLYCDETNPKNGSCADLPEAKAKLYWLPIIDLICFLFFVFNLILHMWVAISKKEFILSFHAINQWATVLAYFIEFVVITFVPPEKYNVGFTYIIATVRITLLFELLRNSKCFAVLRYSIISSLGDVCIVTVIALMFGGFLASVLLNLMLFNDNKPVKDGGEGPRLTFYQAYWLVMCSVTSVTYGDIVPATTHARVWMIFVAICGVFFLSIMVPIFSYDFLTFYTLFQNENHMITMRNTLLSRKVQIWDLKQKVEKRRASLKEGSIFSELIHPRIELTTV